MIDTNTVALHTSQWLQRLVIDLKLCPFAHKPFSAGLVSIVVSEALTEDALLLDLGAQLSLLDATPVAQLETTLLVAPRLFDDFLDYNDFLQRADDLLADSGFEGIYQIASFHPHYQFAGTEPDDAENYTNRAPYPTLHLLREDSLEKILETCPDPEAIPERNIATMNKLGTNALAAMLTDILSTAHNLPDYPRKD